MNLSPTARRVTGTVAWLIAFHVLLAYGLPEGAFIALIVLLGVLFWRIGALGAFTVALTLVMVTVAYGVALRISGFDERIYYRPDEKYVRFDYTDNHRRYEANVHLEADMPHGDLRAMTTADIAEPRRMRFDTDADGFRNSRDYHGQRYLLIGDSFIAGNSNSQDDLLVTQLARDYGLDTYSLAYPGNLADYAAYLRGFRRRHAADARVLLFLFEGNDFEESRGRKKSALARYGRRYYEMFSGLNTYRVTMSLVKRLTRARDIRAGSGLELVELGGKPLAFYRQYMDVTRRPTLPEPEGFVRTLEALRPAIERVYFIPTKYRVYAGHLKGAAPLPNAQWAYLAGLCRKYELRCTDLTTALVREADARLKHGEFIWWRDDTHWNGRGIAVAARVVAADLDAGRERPR
jgi:hypothetical protein